jgi:uncharacterized membrane protein
MKENVQYKNEALASLKGNWPQAVLAILIYMLMAYAVITPMYVAMSQSPTDVEAVIAIERRFMPFIILICIFFLYPLQLGYIVSFKELSTKGDGRIVRNMFKIGLGNYWRHVWGYLLRAIYTFLWSLLLIVPGIIKALSYAMTFYILEDYPELSVNKSIELSMAMMKGRKYDLFYLYLSLIGWFLLSILTLGIGLLWFIPYAQSCQHAFYQDVKHDYLMRRNAEKAASEYAPSATPAAPEATAPDAQKTENPEDYMPK